uniref:Uncharacterized protein n=1 Tax=viral metagenome TaxID=1070528 RepID=A0A6C0JU42_9ZZZZ
MNKELLIKLGPALMMILFGISQMMNPEMWFKYIPTFVSSLVSPFIVMRLHASVNILLGLLLLSGWRADLIVPVVIVWFLSIIPFAFLSDWTIGLRDTAVSLGLISLFV